MEGLIERIDSISLELRRKYLPNLDSATIIAKLEQDEQLRDQIIKTYIFDLIRTDEDLLIALNNSLFEPDQDDEKEDNEDIEEEDDEDGEEDGESETDIDDKLSDQDFEDVLHDGDYDNHRGRMHMRYLYANPNLYAQFSEDDKASLTGILEDLKHYADRKSDSEDEEDEDEDEDHEEYLKNITTQNLDMLRDCMDGNLKNTPYQDLAARYDLLYSNNEEVTADPDAMEIQEGNSPPESNKRKVSDDGENLPKRPRLAVTRNYTTITDTKEQLHEDVDTALSKLEATMDNVPKKLIITGDIIRVLLEHRILVRTDDHVQEFENLLKKLGFKVYLEEEGEYVVGDEELDLDLRDLMMISLEPEVDEMYDRFYKLAADLAYNPSSGVNDELRDDLSLFEIRFERSRTDFVINGTTFKLVCDGIIRGFKTDAHFTPEALDAIQTAAEDYLVKVFDKSNRIAITGKRTIVDSADVVTSVSGARC